MDKDNKIPREDKSMDIIPKPDSLDLHDMIFDTNKRPNHLDDMELSSAKTGPAKNMERTKSLAPPTNNTVRISCHGEYTTNSSLTFSKVPENISDYIQFHVFFRAEVGRCVLARRSTQLEDDAEGATCSLQQKENGDFGIHDFKKDMIIYVNKNNFNKYYIEPVLSRSYDTFPNILFSFNTDYKDENMYLGLALYNFDGINFTPKKKCGFEQLSKLSEYSLELINKTDNNLIQKLLKSYKQDFQGLSSINLYISSCLYVRESILDNIKINYSDWFESHRNTIIVEYGQELQDTIKEINEAEVKIEGLERYIGEMKKTDSNEELEREIRNLDTFIKILSNKVDSIQDYVENYLEGNIDECQIDDLNNLIDKKELNGNNPDTINTELIKEMNEKLLNSKLDLEFDYDDNPHKIKASNLVILKNKLELKKDKLLKIQYAIQKCSSQPGNRSGVRGEDEKVRKINTQSESRIRVKEGGKKKLKKTRKKKKGGKKKENNPKERNTD